MKLDNLHQDRAVRELVGLLNIQKSDGETRPGRWSAGVRLKVFGVVALDRTPVDQACEHDDRMVLVAEIVQHLCGRMSVCPGWGALGFMGASFSAFEPRL